MTIATATIKEIVADFGQEYHNVVLKFTSIWPNYTKVIRELAEPMNEMVDIIFEILTSRLVS
jgi:hypothetical protein